MKNRTLSVAAIAAVAIGACSVAAWAQAPGGDPRPPAGEMRNVVVVGGAAQCAPGMPGMMFNPDPMAENFFPPELVMQHQKAIGLKDEQQKAIRAEMQKVTAKVADLQWDMTSAQQEMVSLAKEGKVDEKQLLAQLDKLLSVESEMRRLQMGLLIKVKNVLTAEQQGKLKELRYQIFPMPMPMGGMGTGIAVPVPAPMEGGVIAPDPAERESKP